MNLPVAGVLGFGMPELLVIGFLLSFLFVVSAVPAVLAFVVLQRVPVEHRKQEPLLAFLLLIPFFAIIWAFFVHPRVAASLQAWSAARGIATNGDCGGSLALALCLCGVVSFVPLLGLLAGLAALVLLVIFYVKAFELSAQLAR